jgi:hypothetical protein
LVTTLQAAIVTNWAAYNDFTPNYTPAAGWFTHSNATAIDMRVAGSTGNLTNFYNGQQLAAMLTIGTIGAPISLGTMTEPNEGTPAANMFKGIVDLGNVNSGIGAEFSNGSAQILNFSGLDPAKNYVFRGTSVRGNYANRWTVATISGTLGHLDAHINGVGGPGVLTSNQYPASLAANQAAWNSGDNREGAVIGWDFITPAPDGTFSITCTQYVGQIPIGTATTANYGYALCGILLAEVEGLAPTITTNPPASTTVEQNRPISLKVAASGTPLFYQWYKQGAGEIAGATLDTYTVPLAALSDTGDYYVVVYNSLGRATSAPPSHVTVTADTTKPGIASAYTFPSYDSATRVATLDQLMVQFTEAVQTAGATAPGSYSISGGIGNPTAVTMTDDRMVVLTLSSALTADTPYTVQVSGVLDLAGNSITGGANNPASFRSWMQGPGNGLLFEVYATGNGVDLDGLTNNANFPNNAFFRTNLWGFDSRIVYPDDSNESYGARIRGVFIPPVSGNWVFYLMSDDRSQIFLNPNGLDAAGKIPIVAEQTGTSTDWNKLASAPVPLIGGRAYYLEGLLKEGTGGDYIKLAARLAGTGLPTLGVPITDINTNALAGGYIASPYAPRDLGGTLSISANPTNTPAEDKHIVTFSVGVNNPSGLPVYYQWYRNGTPVETNGNGPTYSFRATLADDNTSYHVTATKIGSDLVTSTPATLHVVADTTPPLMVRAFTSEALDTITVVFNEELDPASQPDTFFNVNSGAIFVSGWTLQPDNMSGVLTVDPITPLSPNTVYTLEETGARDLSGNGSTFDQITFRSFAPVLEIQRNGTDNYVRWPAPSTGYVLEQSSTLTGGGSWSTVSAAPAVVNGKNELLLPASGAQGFYRLRK